MSITTTQTPAAVLLGNPPSDQHQPSASELTTLLQQIIDAAATQASVDALATGRVLRAPVVAVATSNITLSGAQTIDGVSVGAGDRVAVAGQTAAEENGIYVAATGAWSRATDMDAAAEIDGSTALVLGGTANGGAVYTFTVADPSTFTLDTDAITGVQTGDAGAVMDQLDLKAPLASPALTGTPTAPTASAATDSTQIATTAFVQSVIAALRDGAPGDLQTLNDLAAAIGDDPDYAATVTAALALKAPLASPALTGAPTAPTAETATSNTQIATTAFAHAVANALTATDLGLGAVDNTSDADKPISTATQAALDLIEQTSVHPGDRPGDNPQNFSTSLEGDGIDKTPLSSGAVTAVSGAGLVYVQSGAGTVARRAPTALGIDVWQFAASYRRTADPEDPNNHAVELRVAWLDADRDLISTTVLATDTSATVAGGRRTLSDRVSHATVESVTAPPTGAVYACPYLLTYGGDGATAIEHLRADRVTDLHVIDTNDLSDLISATEAARDAANAAAGSVDLVTLDGYADVAATDLSSAGTVVLRYGVTEHDGLGGLWSKDADDSASAHNPPDVLVSSDGSRFRRVLAEYVTVAELLASTLTAMPEGCTLTAEDYRYEVAPSGATDHHLTTAGGVKLYRIGAIHADREAAKEATDYDSTTPGLAAAAILGKKPFDAAYFGIRPGTSDQRDRIQDAINAAANEGIYALELGSGRYVSDGTLYMCYDETNNPDFPLPAETFGGFKLTGVRAPDLNSYTGTLNLDEAGTTLHFANTTGKGLIVANGFNDQKHPIGQMVGNMGIFGDTDFGDDLVYSDYAPISRYYNLTIGYRGAANAAFRFRSHWVSQFENIQIQGRPGHEVRGDTAIGLWHDGGPGSNFGGQNVFTNVTCSYFNVGHKKGNEYNENNSSSRVDTYIGLQVRHCVEGFQVFQGMQAKVIGSWNEHNTTCHWRIAESAVGVSAENVRMNIVETDQLTEGAIVLGRDSGTVNNIAYRYFELNGCDVLACQSAGIRKYAHNLFLGGRLRLDNVRFEDKGGYGIVVDTGEKGGIDIGAGVDWTDLAEDKRVVKVSGDPAVYTYAPQVCRSDFAPTFEENTNIDMNAQWYLPRTVTVLTTFGDRTVTLPRYIDFKSWGQPITIVKASSANALIIDAQSGNTIRGSQTYTIPDTEQAVITLIPADTGSAIRWDIGVMT